MGEHAEGPALSAMGWVRAAAGSDGTTNDAAGTPALWQGLAHPMRRKQPLKGVDRLGARIGGALARQRVRRLDWHRAERIAALAKALGSYSDAALEDHVRTVRDAAVLTPNDPECVNAAYAAGHETIRRELGLTLHPVQVLAALSLRHGCCAELATGEGKTVTAVLPAMMTAWLGRGLHVVTVNDYLARRDAETLSPVYARLGLSVGVIEESSTPDQRRRAYAADITYACDKQVLFDHLRDRLETPLQPRLTGLLLDQLADARAVGGHRRSSEGAHGWATRIVQRGLFAAIVDEADSVLIDEAVTPAIISGPSESDTRTDATHFSAAARLSRGFLKDTHYTVDEHARRVELSDAGREHLATMASQLPKFWAGPRRREELLVRAITARELYLRDRDYVVRDDEIQIVDRSTGRILPGRQWQLGVHQAVEAKEEVELTPENRSIARSSYQGFFTRYQHIAGMTGTAWEVRHEMWEWYGLPVVRIPTNKPVARLSEPDRVYADETAKLKAVAERVLAEHTRQRPVLVGTWSVKTSERMAQLLRDAGVACEVLNATREAEESAMVAKAGEAGAVMVATNMAGRGTDIRLTPASRAAGGLLVIATERHDEARVDRQLAGRSGRQGDPGGHACYLSFEDQLIREQMPPWAVRLARAITGRRSGRADGAAGITTRWLWAIAQRNASHRWTVSRAEASKADAWLDMALHSATR
jgi:preprotein translocase subunit SecA